MVLVVRPATRGEWLKLTFQTIIHLVKSIIFEVVWFSHMRSEWSMWIGIGNIIQQETRESHQNLSMEQQKASDCLKEKCAAIEWINMDSCVPRGSKDHEVKLATVWKRNSMQRWGIWKGKFLNPCLANYICIL